MNDSGQLYTIEGVAAAIMMVITAYLVISSASIFTPQEKHVAQMQLEQLGHDALVVMDTPRENGVQSNLSDAISSDKPEWFKANYSPLINTRTDGTQDTLNYSMSVFYWDSDTDSTKEIEFFNEWDYHRENAAKVTQWAYIESGTDRTAVLQDTIVLVEVLLWRD